MEIKDTCEESMACRQKPLLLQSKLASCPHHNNHQLPHSSQLHRRLSNFYSRHSPFAGLNAASALSKSVHLHQVLHGVQQLAQQHALHQPGLEHVGAGDAPLFKVYSL